MGSSIFWTVNDISFSWSWSDQTTIFIINLFRIATESRVQTQPLNGIVCFYIFSNLTTYWMDLVNLYFTKANKTQNIIKTFAVVKFLTFLLRIISLWFPQNKVVKNIYTSFPNKFPAKYVLWIQFWETGCNSIKTKMHWNFKYSVVKKTRPNESETLLCFLLMFSFVTWKHLYCLFVGRKVP